MTQLLNEFLSSSSAWGVLLTLAAFALGTLINRVTGKAVFNPLLLGSIFVIILLSVLNISYADYKVSAAPVSYLLLPATISLAIPLYEKWDLLKENAAAIIAGISVGTLVSLGSALALAVAMGLTREQVNDAIKSSVITAFGPFSAGHLISLDKNTVSCISGGVIMLVLKMIADKRALKWVREWSLFFALFCGMMVAVMCPKASRGSVLAALDKKGVS